MKCSGTRSARFAHPERILHVVPVAAVLTWIALVPAARAASEIHFRLVDGKLCARGTLGCQGRSIPANVLIDLGLRVPLLVHERTARLLDRTGQGRWELTFGQAVLRDLRAIATGLKSLEDLTREHATDLGEVPAVAILGLPAFEDRPVELDVAGGWLRVLPKEEGLSSAGPGTTTSGPAEPASCTLAYEVKGHGIWLSARAAGGFDVRVKFSTADYDTLIDKTTADLAGAPGGDLEELLLGTINIARFVALRPEDLSGSPDPPPDVVLGTGFLSHFRVTIDPTAGRIRFAQTRQSQFPAEERAFFVARAREDADAVEAFLTRNPSSRLAGQAGALLVAMRLSADPPDPEAFRRAVRLRADTLPRARCSLELIGLAGELIDANRDELAADVLTLAAQSAPDDPNGVAIHHVHARMGLLALRRRDFAQARRYLLSAAFGLPKDPYVNLWMGRLYEATGKPVRAWSRYVQAAIDDDPPREAFAGLDRLNRDPVFRASFSMEDARELLEGRIPEFHTAERFTPADATSGHARLMELFTCVDDADTAATELALWGMSEYFGPHLSVVQYHLPTPAPDPLACEYGLARASSYAVKDTPTAIVDGVERLEAAGNDSRAAPVFAAYRSAALQAGATANPWRLEGSVRLAGTHMVGTIRAAGSGGRDPRLHIVLCEEPVMLPGANGLVLHRHVARAGLSPAAGLPIPAGGAEHSFDVDVKQISADAEAMMRRLERERRIEFLMEPSYVDARACRIVVFVQDAADGRVLTARTFEPPREATTRP